MRPHPWGVLQGVIPAVDSAGSSLSNHVYARLANSLGEGPITIPVSGIGARSAGLHTVSAPGYAGAEMRASTVPTSSARRNGLCTNPFAPHVAKSATASSIACPLITTTGPGQPD